MGSWDDTVPSLPYYLATSLGRTGLQGKLTAQPRVGVLCQDRPRTVGGALSTLARSPGRHLLFFHTAAFAVSLVSPRMGCLSLPRLFCVWSLIHRCAVRWGKDPVWPRGHFSGVSGCRVDLSSGSEVVRALESCPVAPGCNHISKGSDSGSLRPSRNSYLR